MSCSCSCFSFGSKEPSFDFESHLNDNYDLYRSNPIFIFSVTDEKIQKLVYTNSIADSFLKYSKRTKELSSLNIMFDVEKKAGRLLNFTIDKTKFQIKIIAPSLERTNSPFSQRSSSPERVRSESKSPTPESISKLLHKKNQMAQHHERARSSMRRFPILVSPFAIKPTTKEAFV